jgi:2-oxoglutarate dehydrogenase E2 component (dihydrolipoamide succinyltransferase)
MATEVKVPALGESVTEGTIGEWLKQPGDPVKVDEPIASLETDKVAIEVPSPVGGILGEQKVKVGDTVEVGAVIATIEDAVAAGGGATPIRPREEVAAAPAPAPNEPPQAADIDKELDELPKAGADDLATTLSPSVRRAVIEHGIDPTQVKGTGKDGRLTKEDVLAAATAKKLMKPSLMPCFLANRSL